ncbi:hypothetical protein D3C79_454290 [compost metagenome]
MFDDAQHVVARHGSNRNRNGCQIDSYGVTDLYRVTSGAAARDGNIHRASWPIGHISRRYIGQPGAVRQYAGMVGLAVDADGQLHSRHHAGAGTADHHALTMFNGVDDVITGHGVHTQARQVGVDHKVAATGAGVTVIVGHAGSDAQRAIAQRGQVIGGDWDCPGQVGQHRSGVSLAA